MDPKEFKTLLQSSKSFQQLSAKQKKLIMEATGKDMKEYAQIFLSERKDRFEAIKELSESNDIVHKNYVDEIKSTMNDKREDDEASSEKRDEEKQTELINKLNKL